MCKQISGLTCTVDTVRIAWELDWDSRYLNRDWHLSTRGAPSDAPPSVTSIRWSALLLLLEQVAYWLWIMLHSVLNDYHLPSVSLSSAILFMCMLSSGQVIILHAHPVQDTHSSCSLLSASYPVLMPRLPACLLFCFLLPLTPACPGQ